MISLFARLGILAGISVLSTAGIADSLKVNSLQSLRVTTPGYGDRYIRHADSLGWTETVNARSSGVLKMDASFRVRPGLADGGCYSFESRNYPGHYLRHRQSRIRADRSDGSSTFLNDATFCSRRALDGSSNISLESKNKRGHYIRHRNAELWLDANQDEAGFRQDATWDVTPAWWKSEVSLTYSVQSFRVISPGHTDRFLRHRDGLGFTEAVQEGSSQALKREASFRIGAGLADNSCYSLQSISNPGYYLRHSNYRIHRHKRDGSRVFDEDATFCAQRGRARQGVTLQSYNLPTHALRHAFDQVWISRPQDNPAASYAVDVSWDIVRPWAW